MNKQAHTSDTNNAAAALEARWQRLGVHRASQAALPETWSTAWPGLDALLPGGGYPLAAVTEFLIERPGQGELSLLLTALRPRLDARPDSRLVFVEPPYRLNAPALDGAGIDRTRVPVICCRDTAERVWSIEQLAAAGGFVAFVIWDNALDTSALRRLQLASEKAGCPVFVYRDLACARQRSPAALRLAIHCCAGQQHLEILKCRGPAGGRTLGLSAARDQGWAPSPTVRETAGRVCSEPANHDLAIPPGTPLEHAVESSGHHAVVDQDKPRRSHTR